MKAKYDQPKPAGTTKPGTKPNIGKRPVPGSGRGRPAVGYDPETKTWRK